MLSRRGVSPSPLWCLFRFLVFSGFIHRLIALIPQAFNPSRSLRLMIDDSRRETGGETTQEANPQNHQDDPNHSTGDGLWIQVAVSDGGGGHHRPPDAVSQGAVFEKRKRRRIRIRSATATEPLSKEGTDA